MMGVTSVKIFYGKSVLRAEVDSTGDIDYQDMSIRTHILVKS
jgi:hypothetical protein